MKESGSVSIKEKVFVVCQVIAGGKIQAVARKHDVSRPSVYAWTQKALRTLERALAPGKRGPKLRKGKVGVKDKVIEEQEEKIARLEGVIERKEKQIRNLRGKINLQKNTLPRPSRCPHCGFEKIYKNGTYKIRPERLFEQLLKKDKEIDITIQQFICPYCKSTVRPPEKKRIIIFLQ